MWIFKTIDCGLKVVPLVQPEVLDSGHVAATRGASVEHRKGTERTDTKFHRHIVASVGIGVISDKRTREGRNVAVPPEAGGAPAVSAVQWLSPASRRNVSTAVTRR